MEDSKNLFSLHEKVSIVTGAGRGLGYGIARALAGAGSDLIIVSRSTHELEHVSQEIMTETKQRVSSFSFDLTKDRDRERLVKTKKKLDSLGGVI